MAARSKTGSPTSATSGGGGKVSARTTTVAGPSTIPLLYRLFFLYIEPIATAAGAYYAALDQRAYMHLTVPPSPLEAVTGSGAGAGVSTRESIVLYQLANLYLVFALNEALVLRATGDVRVWKVFLLGLLIADFGHLASVAQVGWEVYYRFWEWDEMYWGNLGFVYVGAMMRSCFLMGVGFANAAVGGKGGKAAKAKR